MLFLSKFSPNKKKLLYCYPDDQFKCYLEVLIEYIHMQHIMYIHINMSIILYGYNLKKIAYILCTIFTTMFNT